MHDPLVSIVTPCFNGGRFLRLPVGSALRQTHPRLELIVVDDGSTEPDTLKALSELKHEKIRVVRQENRGLPGARNTGIREAKGEFILPLDADDQLTPNCLAESLAAFQSRPEADVVYGDYRTFGDEDRFVPTGKYNGYRILFNNHLPVGSMFRRSAWEAVGGYTESMRRGFEDWEFWIKLSKAGFKFHKLDKVLFLYHKHGRSMLDDSIELRSEIIGQIRELHPELYTKESLRRLRRENAVTILEDALYRMPMKLRHKLAKSPLRSAAAPILNLLGLYRDR